jgi:hypothetical protein
VEERKGFSVAKLSVGKESTERVLVFEEGKLGGLVRFVSSFPLLPCFPFLSFYVGLLGFGERVRGEGKKAGLCVES